MTLYLNPALLYSSLGTHLNLLFSPTIQSLTDIGISTDIQQFVSDHHMKLADIDLVRRNSLSLRSPPPESLAAEILLSSITVTPHFARAKSLLSEVKDMAARLSEFESCNSSSSDNESDVGNHEEETDDGFKTMNARKRYWKNKRKLSTTPNKESFVKDTVKKLNQNKSPTH